MMKDAEIGYKGLLKRRFWCYWEGKDKMGAVKREVMWTEWLAEKQTLEKCAEQMWEENKLHGKGLRKGCHNIEDANWMCGSFMDSFSASLRRGIC